MPQYAYSRKNDLNIGDHRSFATLGDAYIDAYILREAFSFNNIITSEKLTELKQKLSTNKNLNDIGKCWLKNHLNHHNNDLPENADDDAATKKAYATAFEAVIEFLFFRYPDKVESIIKKHISQNEIMQFMSQ